MAKVESASEANGANHIVNKEHGSKRVASAPSSASSAGLLKVFLFVDPATRKSLLKRYKSQVLFPFLVARDKQVFCKSAERSCLAWGCVTRIWATFTLNRPGRGYCSSFIMANGPWREYGRMCVWLAIGL